MASVLPAPGLSAREASERLALDGLTVEVLPARHTVPAVGYAVDTPRGWWVYTGDTGPNPALWPLLRERRVAQLVIETAFGEDELTLADKSLHLAPSLLAAELAQLDPSVPVGITHVKPGELPAVTGQIAALNLPHPVRALVPGEQFRLE